jgi:hypothetical protein
MADANPIPVNPYVPPGPSGEGPKPNRWKRACLGGLAAIVAAAPLLCGSAEFRHLGVTFRHANLAILLAIVLICGATTFVLGGLGWVITALRRASRRSRDIDGEAPWPNDGAC